MSLGLEDMEGVSGCRWAALCWDHGVVELTESAPVDARKKLALISKVIAATPVAMVAGNLAFDHGRVLLRRAAPRTLIVFADPEVNGEMIDVIADAMKLPQDKDTMVPTTPTVIETFPQ
ncbi:hypothetical protein [Acanthopleuribacter pedis]|uniref:Uncharacterized protein n=1 Tax=Acanthopleuribacter pedis TaxID=442870 RepID=A0A8J7Q8N7_9BACT|nr:hypothetical protein [Acanthopleuribacter pedis]MBO1320566.1 hypothetical protein [Acanthopleuribacter pedis]